MCLVFCRLRGSHTLVVLTVSWLSKTYPMAALRAVQIISVQVIERANIHDVKGKVLVEFNESQGTFDFPRGRYSIEMYSHFMRMHGTRWDCRSDFAFLASSHD